VPEAKATRDAGTRGMHSCHSLHWRTANITPLFHPSCDSPPCLFLTPYPPPPYSSPLLSSGYPLAQAPVWPGTRVRPGLPWSRNHYRRLLPCLAPWRRGRGAREVARRWVAVMGGLRVFIVSGQPMYCMSGPTDPDSPGNWPIIYKEDEASSQYSLFLFM
jgi:hypothetical protein